MTDAVKLPPMPESDRDMWQYGKLDHYTADQVRAYAIQAVIEERERLATQLAEMDCAHRCGVGHEFAAAIRAQPEPKA